MRISRTKKPILVFAAAFLIFFSAYWLKNFLGLNLFEEFSLSRYPIFSAFGSPVIDSQPFPGVVIDESFDETGLLASLKKHWQFHDSTVEMAIDPDNTSNKIMTIRKTTTGSWRGNFTRFVQVNPGEHYQYSIRVKITGADSSARTGLITYDANRQALSWKNFTQSVIEHDEWLDVRRNFTIPATVKYIRFRITGSGIGTYRFDDFALSKLSTSPTH